MMKTALTQLTKIPKCDTILDMKEEWKSITGYEGLYEVSSLGRVRSLNYHCTGKIKVLKPCKRGYGYLYVKLCKNRVMKKCSIHRLVAETFIQNPLNKPQVNHKDEDKTNNRASNLEWMTAKENSNYGTRNEHVAKVLSKPVLQFTKDSKFVAEYLSTHDAERRTGIAHSSIAKCCRGSYKSAGGSVWRYA